MKPRVGRWICQPRGSALQASSASSVTATASQPEGCTRGVMSFGGAGLHNVEAIQMETIVCAFCRGAGTDPFDIMSSLSTCCVCGGRGTVTVSTPHARCAHCRGTGAIKTLTCTVCRGKGVIPVTGEPRICCSACGGSGDDGSAPAMACLRCHGRGWVTRHPVEAKMARAAGAAPEEKKGLRHE